MSILKVFLKLYCLLPSFCEHPSPVYLYGIAFTYHILNISLFLNPNHPPGQNGYSNIFLNSKFFRGCKSGSLKGKGVLQRPRNLPHVRLVNFTILLLIYKFAPKKTADLTLFIISNPAS